MKKKSCQVLFWVSILLGLNGAGILFSLWSQLFGAPKVGLFFEVIGFLIVGTSIMFYGMLGRRMVRECPALVETYPALKRVLPSMRWLEVCLGVVVAISLLVVLFLSGKGVYYTDYSLPVFAIREHYFLTNHGTLTEVSRSVFLLDGAGFQIGWHGLLLLVSGYVWKKLSFRGSS